MVMRFQSPLVYVSGKMGQGGKHTFKHSCGINQKHALLALQTGNVSESNFRGIYSRIYLPFSLEHVTKVIAKPRLKIDSSQMSFTPYRQDINTRVKLFFKIGVTCQGQSLSQTPNCKV